MNKLITNYSTQNTPTKKKKCLIFKPTSVSRKFLLLLHKCITFFYSCVGQMCVCLATISRFLWLVQSRNQWQGRICVSTFNHNNQALNLKNTQKFVTNRYQNGMLIMCFFCLFFGDNREIRKFTLSLGILSPPNSRSENWVYIFLQSHGSMCFTKWNAHRHKVITSLNRVGFCQLPFYYVLIMLELLISARSSSTCYDSASKHQMCNFTNLAFSAWDSL
jgi:hypothetical protein